MAKVMTLYVNIKVFFFLFFDSNEELICDYQIHLRIAIYFKFVFDRCGGPFLIGLGCLLR